MAVDLSIVFSVVASIILLALSGLFSGLTLGLLGLDPVSLKIVSKGDTTNAKYAQQIIPIRAKGNLLLCTLLLGNVAVNSALSILLANFTGGVVGFALSTTCIVVFGEILPQAACSRYALYIGSKVIGLVRILIFILSPLAWPISKLLDWILGDELGLVYTNRELENLVEVHKMQGQLPPVTAGIMQGALDFSKLTVESVMTEWKSVFHLSSDAKLDFDTLEKIFKSGHSRVPVLETRNTMYEEVSSNVIGLLFVKDLILLDPEDELPIQNIIDTFRHDLKHIDYGTSVKEILDEFRVGRSHLAIVRRPIAKRINGETIWENAGIVTLEDIIENILKMEIEDEFDVENVIENKPSKDEILHLFDYRRTRGMEGMPPQEKTVVYRHLCREVNVFKPEARAVDDVDLQNLLASGKVWRVIVGGTPGNTTPCYLNNVNRPNMMIEQDGLLLYEQGVESEFFTFILDGKAEIFSGRQRFRSEVSRFSILCPELLDRTQQDYLKGLEFSSFVPDFTSRVIRNARILRISRATFHKCLQGKLKNYSRPRREMREKIREIIQRPTYSSRYTVCSGSVRELRKDYNNNQSYASSSVRLEHTRQYSMPHTLSSILGENTAPAENDQRIARSDSVTSLSLSGGPQTPPRPRQRYYDESYVGHEGDGKGHKTYRTVKSTKNIISESTIYNSILSNSQSHISSYLKDDKSEIIRTSAVGDEIVTQPGQKPGIFSDASILISAV